MVPVVRATHVSSSADEAWDVLSQLYTRARPHTASPDASVRFHSAVVPGLAVDHGRLSAAGGRFDPSPGQLNIITVLNGRIDLDFGRGDRVQALASDCYLYLPERSADLQWEDLDALPVRLPEREVAQLAAAQTGLPEDAFKFVSPLPLSPKHGQLWGRTAHLIHQQLNEDVPLSPLLHRALVDVAAAAALETFPSTAMTRGYLPGPGDVRPAAVRRAVAYIDAHLSLPITDTDVAVAAGTTTHALQAAFRRDLGVTVGAHLRRCRLAAARRDLHDADPADRTATALIATRWGFPTTTHLCAALTAGDDAGPPPRR